ncbi:MAG: FeoB-associated Cys-rich membrane protein [Terrisporobacter sp.]
MGNFIVIIVITSILFLAIRPMIKFNKEKSRGDYGCYKCSNASKCKGSCE